MRYGSSWLVALVAILAILVANAPLQTQEGEPLLPEGSWFQVETEGFLLLGNVQEEQMLGLAEDLEKLRHSLHSLVGGDAVTLEGRAPTYVYVLEDTHWSRSIARGAFFVAREHRNYALAFADSQSSPSKILHREYVHQILRNTGTPYPLWLRQGLVEMFGAARLRHDGDGLYIPDPLRLPTFGQPSGFWPIEQLVGLEEVPDLSKPEGSIFRYQSWALTHYLLFGNDEAAQRLPELLARLRAGEPPEEAFDDVFRSILPIDLRAVLVAYLELSNRGLVMRRTPAPSGSERAGSQQMNERGGGEKVIWIEAMPAKDLRVRPMDRVEVLFRLGDLLLEAPLEQQDRAARFLRRALELDPEHGSAHLGLAVLARQSGDRETAFLHVEKALEHLPSDTKWERARAHLLRGSMLLDSLGRRRPASQDDRARLTRAREALRRSTELKPESPEPWTELVIAYGLEPEPLPEELEVVAAAMERFPARTDLVSNAVLAHGRRGDGETAEALYRRLAEMGADERTLTRAREVLLRLAFHEADRLIHQERHDDAIGLFARIQSETTDPRLRQQVSERIALLERAEEYNRFIEKLLESQERMANGDLAGAETLLDELREAARPGKQIEVVEALADRLASLRTDRASGLDRHRP